MDSSSAYGHVPGNFNTGPGYLNDEGIREDTITEKKSTSLGYGVLPSKDILFHAHMSRDQLGPSGTTPSSQSPDPHISSEEVKKVSQSFNKRANDDSYGAVENLIPVHGDYGGIHELAKDDVEKNYGEIPNGELNDDQAASPNPLKVDEQISRTDYEAPPANYEVYSTLPEGVTTGTIYGTPTSDKPPSEEPTIKKATTETPDEKNLRNRDLSGVNKKQLGKGNFKSTHLETYQNIELQAKEGKYKNYEQKNLAIQTVTPNQSKETTNRELDNARMIRDKNIPGAVKVRGVIETDLGAHIVTKFCNKGDLESFLNNPNVNEKVKLELIKKAFDSLATMHESNVAHHDIKLDNFLVHQKKNGEYEVYINDYGYVSDIEDPQPKPETINITHGPPEFIEGAVSWNNTSYDTWMAGCMLAQAAGNIKNEELPWRSKQDKAMNSPSPNEAKKLFMEHIEQKKNLEPLFKNVNNTELKTLISKMMNPNPDQRISMRDAATELDNVISTLQHF